MTPRQRVLAGLLGRLALVLWAVSLLSFARLARRTGVLFKGRLVEMTDTETLLHAPGHEWSKKMVRMTLLFISHDPLPIQRLCRHLVVMSGGRIVSEGRPETLFSSPDHPAARDLFRSYRNNAPFT